MKLTPIFPPHIKPVRKGVYKTSRASRDKPLYYAYWNGKYWGFFCHYPEDAYEYKSHKSKWQNKRWQGVAHG